MDHLTSGFVGDVLSNVLANVFCLGLPLLVAILLYRIRGYGRCSGGADLLEGPNSQRVRVGESYCALVAGPVVNPENRVASGHGRSQQERAAG